MQSECVLFTQLTHSQATFIVNSNFNCLPGDLCLDKFHVVYTKQNKLSVYQWHNASLYKAFVASLNVQVHVISQHIRVKDMSMFKASVRKEILS